MGNVSNLNTAIEIGSLSIFPPVIAAPMAGYTRVATRVLYRRFGAGMILTEMVSSKALAKGNERTVGMLHTEPEEDPVGIQVFGGEIEDMRRAVEVIEQKSRACSIDLNMGCPVKKISGKGYGSALMRDPQHCHDLVRAMVESTSLPVTVKMRTGASSQEENYLEVALAVEEGGASAVTLHPRSKEQKFQGQSNWEAIANLKKSLKIPVIGNGDIQSLRDAISMAEITNCDGIMLGRGVVGNPWLFRELSQFCETGEELEGRRERSELLSLVLEHFQLEIQYSKRPQNEYLRVRKSLPEYFCNQEDYEEIREQICLCSSNEELLGLLQALE